MFDATLLDSSPARAAVLDFRHWIADFVVGAMGFGVAYFVLPSVFATAPQALFAESLLVGIGVMLYELMLWYVLADARHLRLDVWKWSLILLLLNVVGFLIYLIYSGAKTGDWKRAALPIAYMLEATCLVVLLVIPLIYTQALPDSRWRAAFIPSPPAAPPAVTRRGRVTRGAPPRAVLTAPQTIPAHIMQIKEQRDASQIAAPDIAWMANWTPGGPGADSGSERFGVLKGTGNVLPPPELPKQHQATPIHVGGMVEQAKLIFRPSPEYPPLAKMARIQGIVLLEAVISKGGTIQHLQALSGHPLLLNAAMDAVAPWRYLPTLLNGEPIEVITEVKVKFILGD